MKTKIIEQSTLKLIVLRDEAYDDEILYENKMEFAVYDYYDDGYSGYGNCIAYKDRKWYYHYMGHCSCYGPFDEFSLAKPYNTLDEALEACITDDWSDSFIESEKTMKEIAQEWLNEQN